MNRNKLSRREREARTKIIQECNLNRQGQQAGACLDDPDV